MRFITMLILTSFLSTAALADDSVVFIKKTTPAPFTGYLISPEKAEKIRTVSIEHDTYQQVNADLKQTNVLLEKQFKGCKEQNSILADKISNTKDSSIWVKAGYFVLGAVITGAIAYGTTRAIK